MKRNLPALISGILFGFGLAFSGMTDTHKVLGFLDIFGAWDYDLAFVMGGALLVSIAAFQLMKNRKLSLLDCPLEMPANTRIDPKLISGSALFGVGWGLFGYCPGPALTALIYFDPITIVFVLSMVLGIVVHKYSKLLQSQITIKGADKI